MFLNLARIVVAAITLASMQQAQAEEAYTLSITGLIDGSGVFTFTDGGVKYEHKSWKPPQFVVFNDKAWDDLAITPAEWSNLRGKLDLAKAKIVRREGRDIIALEHTDSGFQLFVADAPNAAEPYAILIRIPYLPVEAPKADAQAPNEKAEAPSVTPAPTTAAVAPRAVVAPAAPTTRRGLFGGRWRSR